MGSLELLLRPSDQGDSDGIRALLRAELPASPRSDPEIMSWQYWENPFGRVVSWVWLDEDAVVCHLARMCVPMLIGGSRSTGSIGVDGATAPSYRRRGLYLELLTKLSEEACRREIPVALNFRPRSSLLPRGDGAPAVDALRRYALPLDADWLAEHLRVPRRAARLIMRCRSRRIGTARGQEVPCVSDEVDPIWRSREGGVRFGIIKDSAWWQWRYEAHPRAPYRYFVVRDLRGATGAAVTRVRKHGSRRVVTVLELVASDPASARDLVATIAQESQGAAALVFAAAGAWRSAARASGMWLVPRWLEPDPATVNARDHCGNRPELLTAPWSVTSGDMDHL